MSTQRSGDGEDLITAEEYLAELNRVHAAHGYVSERTMNRYGAVGSSPAKRLFDSFTQAKIEAGLLEDTPDALVMEELRELVAPGDAVYVTSKEIAVAVGLDKRAVGRAIGRIRNGEADVPTGGVQIERWSKTPARWRVER